MPKEFDPEDPILNLEGVIIDIRHGIADEVCINTLVMVGEKIIEMKERIKVLEQGNSMNPKTHVTDIVETMKIADTVITENPKLVEDAQHGNEKAKNAIVGQIMKANKGQVNPELVEEVVRYKLAMSNLKETK